MGASIPPIFLRCSIQFKVFLVGCLVLIAVACAVSDPAAPQGFLEGNLHIYSPRPVEPEGGIAATVTAETYAEYPLVVLGQDTKKEVAIVKADENGHYRLALPPGAYLLDVQNRVRKHVRAKPQPFTVVPNQTVHVNIEMDTGIR